MSQIMVPVLVFFAGLFLIVGKEQSGSSVPGERERARDLAITHISKIPKGSMIVFDFDDTLFDPHVVIGHVHGGTRDFAFGPRKALPLYKPINPICDVLRYAVAAGMYITVITARPDTAITKQIIFHNFKHNKMAIHEFHANPHFPRMENFKAGLRAAITKFRPIALTIGDAWTDVNEANGYHYIKLPNKSDPYVHSSLQR